MQTFHSVDLFKYNSMRLHSIADIVYVPESIEDLISILNSLSSKGQTYHILSAGSNIVFEEYVTTPIINLMSLNQSLNQNEDGTITAGCSIRIQKLIRACEQYGVGGIEYLFSLPASVGGCVFMNAGRGRASNMSISNYLYSVEYLDISDMTIKSLVGNDDYSYRFSPFQTMNAIILSATFKFREQTPEDTESKIKERIVHSKKTQPVDLPSCGSVFNKSNKWLMLLMRGKRVGGAMFSRKINNWISNVDNASATDIKTLVSKAQRLHRFFGQECNLEIRILK